MADLETLRPEVAEAVAAIDDGNGVFVDSDDGIGSAKWKIIRAELLRLAKENIALKAERDHAKLPQRKAEAELADAQRMFWCLLHSHKAPLIVHRDAMVSYHKQTAELVRRDLPNGDIEFLALVRESVEG